MSSVEYRTNSDGTKYFGIRNIKHSIEDGKLCTTAEVTGDVETANEYIKTINESYRKHLKELSEKVS